jgi:hypothetical protein
MTEKDNPFEFSEDLEKDFTVAIKNGVRAISEGFKTFADEMREFNENKKEIEERIKNGARRTTGRIV